MFTIDAEKRQVIINKNSKTRDADIVLNEFDELNRKFLQGTKDKYKCELVLLEVDTIDPITQEKTGTELKAFARRIGYTDYLIGFNPNEFDL